jgi:ABC-type amino acid transport substrate-binding protein
MKLSVLMASMAAAVLFTATGAQAADTLAKIAESGKITLAYRESSVPFSYLDGPNKPIGFSVELSNAVVEAVKKKLNKPNLQVSLMAVTSQNRIPLITNGTIDLECGSTTNNSARGKDVAFAINHFYTGTRLLVKKSSKIKDYADLAKKTVASTTGTTNALVMRKYNTEKNLGMDIVLGKDHADAFLLVESDRAVAFAMDDILLFGLIANSKNAGRLRSGGRVAAGRALRLHAAQGRPGLQEAGGRHLQRHDEERRVREALHQVVHAADSAEGRAAEPADERAAEGEPQGQSDKPAT